MIGGYLVGRLRRTAQQAKPSVSDQAAGQFQKGFVHVGPAFPAGSQAPEAMQPGKSPLDHPPIGTQPGAVPGAPAGDRRDDAAGADLVAVDVVVVAAVGEEGVGLAAAVADSAADRWDCVEQGHQLGDVVAVAAGQQDGERGAMPVGDQVVLRAGPAAVDR